MADTLTQSQIDEIRQRVQRISDIELGALPTVEELHTGHPFARLSIAHDRRVWLSALRLKLPANDELSPLHTALDLAIADGSCEVSAHLLKMLGEHGSVIDEALLADALQRLRIYAALEDDRAGELDDLIEYLLPVGLQPIETVDAIYRFGLAIGLRVDNSTAPEQITHAGLETLIKLGDFARRVLAAGREAVTKSSPTVRPLDVDTATVEEIIEQQESAGFFHRQPPGVVVIPPAPPTTGKTLISRDIWKSIEAVAGQPLPIIDVADLVKSRSALTRRYPHLMPEIDIALHAPQPPRLLLVGEPGCGKTAFAQSLAEALGLQSMMFSAAGVADGAFGGTSSQWNSARMSVPLQMIARSRCANPVIILDEIDKSDPGRNNGSLGDTLLTFLEPRSASRVMDLALEVEVDLSRVGYIATANKLEDVPAVLRDRFRVIRVPLPDPVYLPALSEHVLNDIAADREIDRRWLQPLEGDELEIVGKAWSTRSMRQLRRLIETIINGRELLATRS